MALRNLTNEEMVQVSSGWTAGTSARGKLEAVPLLKGLLPQLDQAHEGLLRASTATEDARLKELSAQAAQVDAVHDTLLRGLYDFLTGLSLLVEDGQRFITLRDRLFPDGPAMIQRSYRGQAGAAEMIRERLTPAVEQELQSIPVPGTHLGERVEAWLKAAAKLGALEDERAQLANTPPTPRGMLMNARLSWIRAVNALVANAQLVELSPEDDAAIFNSLRQAEAAGDARSARRRTNEVTPEPTPEPDAEAEREPEPTPA